MNFLWTLLFMTFIGALIGGFTNHLAIRMLFRPFKAKYIGSWRLPFTPGLIPKRRDELATQLGRTVTNYLLTPETFKKKLFTENMEQRAEQFLQQKLTQHIFQSERTLQDWLDLVGMTDASAQVNDKLMDLLDKQLNIMKNKITSATIEEIVPKKWLEQLEQKIPDVSAYILNQASDYFQSEEGRQTLKQLIDDFLASKGTLGNMIHMFFGESNTLVGKAQKEALNFLSASGTRMMLNEIIVTEWKKLQKRPSEQLLQGFDWTGLFEQIKSYAEKQLALSERFEKPLIAYWPNAEEWTSLHFTPTVTRFAFEQAELQLEKSLRKLKLDDMVKEQVDSFPVEVLEDLVLGISRREFKMITVLGAVLGGAIGIVQGFIVFLTN